MLSIFRIGSKPVLVIISFLMIVFFSSCTNRSETELTIFKALDESLVNSNLTINKSTETILSELNGKTNEPASANKANFWYPKAMMVKEKSAAMISYLEELKAALKKEEGFDKKNNSFREDDINAVNRLFDTKQKGRDLYEKLNQYEIDVLAIHPKVQNVFVGKLLLTSKSFESMKNKSGDFTKTFFKNISTAGALAIISKFQNNIKISENKIIVFCNNQVGSFIEYYSSYSAIVAQSKSYVRAGEKIEITSGVGYFSSRQAQAEVTVNGTNVDIDKTGVAVYKFNASTIAGKHIVPVKINFTDQEGKDVDITKEVEYTVVNEINKKD